MSFRFGVLQVQSASEGLKRVVVGLLEFHVLHGELRGALLDELFQVALIIAVFDDQPAVLKSASNAQKKLVLFEGLEDVVIGAAANGFQCCGNVMDCRDHDHRHFGIVLAHPFQQPDPVHLGHDHVAQHQVGRCLLDLVLRDAAVLHGRAVITLRLEHGRDDFSNRFLIVHDENVFHLHGGLPLLGIICDGTHNWGWPCPVRKQRVSVNEGDTLRASRRP